MSKAFQWFHFLRGPHTEREPFRARASLLPIYNLQWTISQRLGTFRQQPQTSLVDTTGDCNPRPSRFTVAPCGIGCIYGRGARDCFSGVLLWSHWSRLLAFRIAAFNMGNNSPLVSVDTVLTKKPCLGCLNTWIMRQKENMVAFRILWL